MKLQLFVTLFVYFVYHCSFAKVADGPDEFCDEGPPGNYCLPDLTGWHNCYVDQKTGQMVDKITTCSPNTRCVCFDGPPCPDYIEDPCQTFIPPPPTPDKFTMYYNSKLTVCSPMGCKTTYSSGRELQSLTDLKKRDDHGSIYWSSTFVLPRPGGGFNQTEFRWDKEQCVTQEIKTFPVSQVPPFFSFNGTVKVGYLLCDKWIWKTGGHNPGQPTTFQAYYITNQTNAASDLDKASIAPVMIESTYNSGPLGKTSSHMVLNVTSFAIGVDEDSFELPTFCLNRPSIAMV